MTSFVSHNHGCYNKTPQKINFSQISDWSICSFWFSTDNRLSSSSNLNKWYWNKLAKNLNKWAKKRKVLEKWITKMLQQVPSVVFRLQLLLIEKLSYWCCFGHLSVHKRKYYIKIAVHAKYFESWQWNFQSEKKLNGSFFV